MTATLPTLAKLKPNPHWAKLPLFNRKGWKRHRFDQIAENIRESVMPTPEDSKTYIGLEHMDTGSLHVRRWGSEADLKGQKLRMRKGDILFARRNAYLRRVAIAPHDGLFSAHGMILRAKTEVVLQEFLPFLMMSDRFMNLAEKISVGSLSPTINWTTLKLEEFDLPPLDQQRRIAEILWAVDEVLNKYAATATATEALLRRFLDSLFKFREAGGLKTPFGCVPDHWRLSRMEDEGGVQLGQQKHPKYDTGSNVRPYLRVDNVRDGWIAKKDVLQMHFPEHELVKFELQPNDILLNEGQTREYVGRSAIYRGEITGCCFQKTLIRFRCNESLLPEFAQAYFRFLLYSGFFAAQSSQTGIAHITAIRFKRMPIAVPPLKEQHKAVDELRKMEVAEKAVEAHLAETRLLLNQITAAIT